MTGFVSAPTDAAFYFGLAYLAVILAVGAGILALVIREIVRRVRAWWKRVDDDLDWWP